MTYFEPNNILELIQENKEHVLLIMPILLTDQVMFDFYNEVLCWFVSIDSFTDWLLSSHLLYF